MPSNSRGGGRGIPVHVGRGIHHRNRNGIGSRGNYRGVRGHDAHGRRQTRHMNHEEQPFTENEFIDIDQKSKDLFSGSVSFEEHFDCQMKDPVLYAATLAVLFKSGYKIPQNAKVRCLAATWARNDKALSQNLLQMKKNFGVSVILKAFLLLDAGRQARIVEKKMMFLKKEATVCKHFPQKYGKLKYQMNNLMEMRAKIGSGTNRVCKEIKKWVGSLSPQELEFYALHFPTDSWKKLSDLCHLHPEKDFSLSWFLPFCYGKPPPDESLVHQCKDLTQENVNEFLPSCPLPYAHIKSMVKSLTNESKGIVAANEPKLETVIWYYEDLKCKQVDLALQKRLQEGYKVEMATGKLFERLLVLKMIREGMNLQNLDDLYFHWDWERLPHGPPGIRECIPDYDKAPFYANLLNQAEEKLKSVSLTMENPVFIMGDASASMEVAIRTSAIITGILTAITSAKLSFFSDKDITPDFMPSSAEEAINLAISMQACSSTCPAASLYPLYEKKYVVKTIIIVTDEEENSDLVVEEDGALNSYSFLDIYKKYHDEVFPAQLVFVSFLEQTQNGQMVQNLQAEGISVLQYKLDKIRPDLSKLDRLFAQLAAKTSKFQEEVEYTRQLILSHGMDYVFRPLTSQN